MFLCYPPPQKVPRITLPLGGHFVSRALNAYRERASPLTPTRKHPPWHDPRQRTQRDRKRPGTRATQRVKKAQNPSASSAGFNASLILKHHGSAAGGDLHLRGAHRGPRALLRQHHRGQLPGRRQRRGSRALPHRVQGAQGRRPGPADLPGGVLPTAVRAGLATGQPGRGLHEVPADHRNRRADLHRLLPLRPALRPGGRHDQLQRGRSRHDVHLPEVAAADARPLLRGIPIPRVVRVAQPRDALHFTLRTISLSATSWLDDAPPQQLPLAPFRLDPATQSRLSTFELEFDVEGVRYIYGFQ